MIDLGPPEHCLVIEDGIQWVVDPRSWILWLYATWFGLTWRATPRGMDVWEIRPPLNGLWTADTFYYYTAVRHSKVAA